MRLFLALALAGAAIVGFVPAMASPGETADPQAPHTGQELPVHPTHAANAEPRVWITFPEHEGSVVVVSGMLDMHVRVDGFEPGVDGNVVCLQETGEPHHCYDSQGSGKALAQADQDTIKGAGGVGHLVRLGNLAPGTAVEVTMWLQDGAGRRLASTGAHSFAITATAALPVTDVQASLSPPAGSRVTCVNGRWRAELRAERLPVPPGPDGPVACLQHTFNKTLHFSEQTFCFPLQEGPDGKPEFVAFLDDCREGLHNFYAHVMLGGESLTPVLATHVLVEAPAIEQLHALVEPFIYMGGSWGKDSILDALAAAAGSRHSPLICEIGFNAGYSSATFLLANPQASVVAFDTNEHTVVSVAKRWIDDTFPGRHRLVLGDSIVEVPRFFEQNPDVRCDIAFVDGGHDEATVRQDLQHMRAVMAPGGVVFADDVWTECPPCPPQVMGPRLAWDALVAQGQLQTKGCVHEPLGAKYCEGVYL